MPSKKYLALTIGPIYKTLQKAKNTQSLWGASYLISFLMKQISKELRTNYANEFIIPYIKDEKIFQPQKGAGLFPDRLIIKNGNIKDLENAIANAIDKLIDSNAVEAINEEILEQNALYKKTLEKTNELELKSYLFKYFLFGAIEIRVEDGKNVIEECGKQLSILELQSPHYSEEKRDLLYFLIQNSSETNLIHDAFESNNYRFPSISEISTVEFEKKYPEKYQQMVKSLLKETGKKFRKIKKGERIEDDEDKLFETLKEKVLQKEDVFRRYHKYIAIVKADGDNMGKAVMEVYKKDASKVEEIDKAILRFNLKAVGEIDTFGGKSIYLGGDDLVFFAPISSNGQTIFQLVKKLSDAFNTAVGKAITDLHGKDITTPTLSFGISITYYKYPMNEALSLAENLLKKAKNKTKNAISFQVMKHSGHYFGTRFQQDKNYYLTGFLDILTTTNLKDEDAFLSSIMYRIRDMEYLIKAILKAENAQERLKNFFDNNFNEGVHSTKRAFLDKVADFISHIYLETKKDDETTHDLEFILQTVYSTLRLVQFIHQKDTQNDD